MKKILYILLLIITLVPSVSLGQNRPDSVDNSAWFPPAEKQMHLINCSHFSLVYYLKSYLWNKKFQRDPNLPENQFSPDFTWNQMVDNDNHYSNNEPATELMNRQGCATVANFPLQTDIDNMPDFIAKESGLRFRSKKISGIMLYSQDSAYTAAVLNQLKDSLNQGVCFTLHIPIFDEINNVTAEDPFYYWNSGMSQSTISYSHYVAIVGYNENLQAFKIVNSWGADFGGRGYFFMGYNWFFSANWWGWDCTFLTEDFNYFPKLSLNINIQGTISGEDIEQFKYLFVDTVYNEPPFGRVDYRDYDYFFYDRLVTIKKVNNQIVPSKLPGEEPYNNHNIVFLPIHNHDGNRLLIEDLTTYVNASDFNSLELLVVDPISATYIAPDNSVIYSYTRNANSTVNEAYVKFLGTFKRIVGVVTDLPDTTIITSNFNSLPAGYHVNPQSFPTPIKTCTSVLKRKKITFSIADTINFSNPPYFTSKPSDTLRVKPGNQLTYQFKAEDPDKDLLKYSLSPLDPDAQIDSLSGLFQYQSLASGVKQFEAIVTDGINNIISNFTVVCNTPPSFAVAPPDTLKGKPGTLITYQFQAQDTDGDALNYTLSPLVAEAQLDPATGLFQYQSDIPAVKKFSLVVTDGHDKVSTNFMVKVSYGVGINDLENSAIATLAQNYPNPFYGNSTISFTLIKGGYVSLKVYNLLGQELTTLLSKELNPGTYNNIFNASGFPPGIYTYRLQVDGFVFARKMVLTK